VRRAARSSPVLAALRHGGDQLREYETVIVLDPTLDEARVNQEIEAVGSVITQGGGEVVEIQNWGRRPLAYEVRKKREGIYSIIRFKSTKRSNGTLMVNSTA